jgi:hypothetical protein
MEARTAFTARQIEQAVELIEDAAIIPAAILGYFYTVSSDGTEIYQTAADICSCLASKECYHRAAVGSSNLPSMVCSLPSARSRRTRRSHVHLQSRFSLRRVADAHHDPWNAERLALGTAAPGVHMRCPPNGKADPIGA